MPPESQVWNDLPIAMTGSLAFALNFNRLVGIVDSDAWRRSILYFLADCDVFLVQVFAVWVRISFDCCVWSCLVPCC